MDVEKGSLLIHKKSYYDELIPKQKIPNKGLIKCKVREETFTVCSQKTGISLTRMIEIPTVAHRNLLSMALIVFFICLLFV